MLKGGQSQKRGVKAEQAGGAGESFPPVRVSREERFQGQAKAVLIEKERAQSTAAASAPGTICPGLLRRCEQRQMESSAAGAHLRGAAASILAPLRNPSVPGPFTSARSQLQGQGPRSCGAREARVARCTPPPSPARPRLASGPGLRPHGCQALPAPLPQLACGGPG
ncbi:hypothetical protein J1605_015036 [Eschrichtius robustus]|uniref:Uncharacterized protein n=1 Tax=Eschrichtius robustus TaxID=9764 RepID=A0AB34GBK6_ESCRO|nr:hypothetical protein J1605_015036 [Eschrichtius robustus]